MNSLFDLIKRDAKFIINQGGYDLPISITTPDDHPSGIKTANIRGWAVKITGAFDTDGNQVNTKNVHITIDEDSLKAQGYPVRTHKKKILEVDLQRHKVSFADSSGEIAHYVVTQTVPDENLGLITLWLGDFRKY